MKIDFLDRGIPTDGTLIIGVFEEKKLEGVALDLDKKTGGSISRAMTTKVFKGKKDDLIRLTAPSGLKVSEIILLGLGKEKDVTQLSLEELGAKAACVLEKCKDKSATIHFSPLHTKGIDEDSA